MATILAALEKIGQSIIPTSGHTLSSYMVVFCFLSKNWYGHYFGSIGKNWTIDYSNIRSHFVQLYGGILLFK